MSNLGANGLFHFEGSACMLEQSIGMEGGENIEDITIVWHKFCLLIMFPMVIP